MPTINETIQSLNLEELRQFCKEQNESIGMLMMEVSRLKAELEHGKKLVNRILDEVEKLRAEQHDSY